MSRPAWNDSTRVERRAAVPASPSVKRAVASPSGKRAVASPSGKRAVASPAAKRTAEAVAPSVKRARTEPTPKPAARTPLKPVQPAPTTPAAPTALPASAEPALAEPTTKRKAATALPPSGSPTSQRRRERNQLLMDAVRTDLVRASAASEKRPQIEGDVAQWIAQTLAHESLAEGDLLEQLETGAVLGQLLRRINASSPTADITATPVARQAAIAPPPHSWLARDSIALFLKGCRALPGMGGATFEVGDLVDRKNRAAVVRTLIALSRVGAKRGLRVPSIVRIEDEVDDAMATDGCKDEVITAEQTSAPAVYRAVLACEIDVHLERMIATHAEMAGRFERITRGAYWLRLQGGVRRKIFLRVLWKQVVVRVGGGWEDVLSYCMRHR